MNSRESTPGSGRDGLEPPTPRQMELLRIIQSLPSHARTTLTLVCRGTEPWEIQKVVEDERIGEIRPRSS
ncbi:MAG TPA: hypothetical protein VE981_22945 [Planctomycetota bacterium]|nr:hypothetical protein [Planctomycetota bacterium]